MTDGLSWRRAPAQAFVRTCRDRDAEVLRFNPSRGIGERYARTALNELMLDALEQHLGFVVTPEGSRRQ